MCSIQTEGLIMINKLPRARLGAAAWCTSWTRPRTAFVRLKEQKPMTRKNKIVFWLITVLCTGAAFSQVPIPGIRTGPRAQAKKSPVAYVYVNVVEGNKAEIYAFAADSKGGLSGIPGSPFPGFADVGYWAGK